MLKVQQSSSKLKPLYLLTPNNQRIEVLIFFTNSENDFWIKERENDWQEVSITKKEAYRSCYTEYYSNKRGYEQITYSSFDKSRNLLNNSYRLDEIPLSVAKLEEIGITQKLELDLSKLPETLADAEKVKEVRRGKDKFPASRFQGDFYAFFDSLSDKCNQPSEQVPHRLVID